MKKKLGITLLMAFLLLSLLLALTSCNCQHRDADDNSLCDMCGARFVDGKDVDDHVHNFPEGSTECSCGALKSSEGLEFELNADGKSCTVTGIGSFKGTNLVIDTYNNLPVTSIGDYAFSRCDSLVSITIGGSVTSIGDSSFYSCENLVSITVDEDNTAYKSIDENLYTKDGKTLVQYAIGKTATSFTIPDNVTSIGDYAFSSCDSLKYNEYDNAYYLSNSNNPHFALIKAKDYDITSCIINEQAKVVSGSAFSGCESLVSITVDEDNTAYKSIDGNLYTKDGKTLVQYAIGKTANSFTIPDSVTSIGDYAFSWCDSLESVTISNSVTSIGDEAFYGCGSLESVTIGDSVTSIGDEAFYRCDSLESVTIGDSVTSIGDYAFYGCDSLTSITIPDSVTSIGVRAFYYCESLESVTIGDSVTSIGYGAFSDCVSLESIKYCGTEAEWNEISKGNDWNYNAGSCTMTYNYTDE